MSWKLVSVILGATAIAQAALAADLAPRTFTKAPVIGDPVYDWTGGYIGANLGYGVASDPVNLMFTPAIYGGERPTLAPSGFLGGGQLGYNFQAGQVVFGVEGDIQATGLRQTICFDWCGALTFRLSQELPWFATARGRIGYAAGPALFYATGGAAFTDIKTTLVDIFQPYPTVTGAFNDARTGWVVGGGVEAALGGHWSAKAEYLYMDFGTVTHSVPDAFLGPASPNVPAIDVHQHVFRVGLNYLFNDPGRGSALASFASIAPMLPAVHNWSGFYVGGNLGGGVGTGPVGLGYDNIVSDQTNFAAPAFNGGLQAGVNWQVRSLVLGVEGDIQLNSQHQNECYAWCIPDQNTPFTMSLPWFATERARLGYAAGPLLFYGTAGAAQGRVDTSYLSYDTASGGQVYVWSSGKFADVRSGWTAGGGVEAALSDRWSAKAEYLYLDLGSATYAMPVNYYFGGSATINSTTRDHIFRVGVNYKVAPF
jgi:outer membrane immunogenic protein